MRAIAANVKAVRSNDRIMVFVLGCDVCKLIATNGSGRSLSAPNEVYDHAHDGRQHEEVNGHRGDVEDGETENPGKCQNDC